MLWAIYESNACSTTAFLFFLCSDVPKKFRLILHLYQSSFRSLYQNIPKRYNLHIYFYVYYISLELLSLKMIAKFIKAKGLKKTSSFLKWNMYPLLQKKISYLQAI